MSERVIACDSARANNQQPSIIDLSYLAPLSSFPLTKQHAHTTRTRSRFGGLDMATVSEVCEQLRSNGVFEQWRQQVAAGIQSCVRVCQNLSRSIASLTV